MCVYGAKNWLCWRGFVMWKQEGTFLKLLPKTWRSTIVCANKEWDYLASVILSPSKWNYNQQRVSPLVHIYTLYYIYTVWFRVYLMLKWGFSHLSLSDLVHFFLFLFVVQTFSLCWLFSCSGGIPTKRGNLHKKSFNSTWFKSF